MYRQAVVEVLQLIIVRMCLKTHSGDLVFTAKFFMFFLSQCYPNSQGLKPL